MSLVEVPHWSTELERVELGSATYRMYRDREPSVLRFLEIAQRWRGRTYVVQGDERWTVEEVHEAAERRAARLVEAGIGHGARVMLLGWNSVDWILGFWAVLRAGGVVVTANAWWSEEEVRSALDLSQPDLVLTSMPQLVRDIPSLTFVALAEPIAAAPPPEPLADEEATCLVMFTSGTTGLPKAAVFTHRAIVAGMQSQLALTKRLPQLLPDDHPAQVTLQAGPLFHIGGVQAILRSALLGGKLVLTRGRFDPGEVLELIEREHVDRWAGVVPTMALRVASHPDLERYDLSSMKSVAIGSTAVPDAVLVRLRQIFPNATDRVGTGWGLTEAGGQLTAASGRDTIERPGTVGRPLPIVDLRIADADETGSGELLARSPMQMSGYLGEEKSSVLDEEGWLHTGDVGRFDKDGFLWLTGRNKDLILRGGENVAAPRVEQVLLEHPAVADVAVVGLPDLELGEIVAAAVVLRSDADASADDLAAFAAERLSKFAVPTRWWLRADPLPTNDVGKVLKAELRECWPVEQERIL